MTSYLPYVLSPLFYLGVSLISRLFTSQGLEPWYRSLTKPPYTPPGGIISAVWITIYILAAISLILFVNAAKSSRFFWLIISVYLLNGVLNIAWSYIFFTKHMLGLAVIDAALIGATVAFIIEMVRPHTLTASLLLVPYLLWATFALFLSFAIYRMNPSVMYDTTTILVHIIR